MPYIDCNTMQISRPQRQFLPADFAITTWEGLEPYFKELSARSIDSVAALKKWLQDRSELESLLEEDMGWRYIRMTCDTASPANQEAFSFFVREIEPHVAPYTDQFNRKYHDSPFRAELSDLRGKQILDRGIAKALEIYREENVPLITLLQELQQQYGAITGAMTISYQGKELTMPQASALLQSQDRTEREAVWTLLQERRANDRDKLSSLYSELIALRDRVASNAGFANYRDYMFAYLGRFDYTPADTFAFHDAIATAVVPIEQQQAVERKHKMALDTLRPWDLAADPEGRGPQKAFENGEDLLTKTMEVFTRLRPELGQYLQIMKDMGHLDLESRVGKAPGGYNYPLDEIGVPFIFMNATSTVRDMVTMLHEGGHAIHSFVTRELPLNSFKHTPSEVAELASMSMELISMDHWDVFFPDAAECKRSKLHHLEDIVQTLPWVACIDAFQHWVYENPTHTLEEREANWTSIHKRFSPKEVDWSGFEDKRAYVWQKQLHLYDVPFYYIEYGMAQLGAIAIWRNFKQNREQALDQYLAALKLGYTATIGEIYATAGISFDFSAANIQSLMQFLKDEISELQNS